MDKIVDFKIESDFLTLQLSGRIDASNANQIELEIFKICDSNKFISVIIDAENLEYISSAGLRVILKLRKNYSGLKIINVSSAIYEILDVTGFTDMITVEKAYQKISIEGCKMLGKGANGAVYRYDDETIVKVYFNSSNAEALEEIRKEREMARKAFVLGINTAIPYGVVKVGDNFGTLTELLNAVSISNIISQNEQDITLPTKYYVDTLKKIHSVKVEKGELPDMKKIALNWADFVSPHLAEGEGGKLKRLISEIPDTLNMLHGDYHTNNVMVQNGEPLLIDMDTLCMGHPIFELASMFNAFIGFAEATDEDSRKFLGFSTETSKKIWHDSLGQYLETTDEARIKEIAEKAMIIGYTRILRRSIRHINEPESPNRIENCKKQLSKLLKTIDSLSF